VSTRCRTREAELRYSICIKKGESSSSSVYVWSRTDSFSGSLIGVSVYDFLKLWRTNSSLHIRLSTISFCVQTWLISYFQMGWPFLHQVHNGDIIWMFFTRIIASLKKKKNISWLLKEINKKKSKCFIDIVGVAKSRDFKQSGMKLLYLDDDLFQID